MRNRFLPHLRRMFGNLWVSLRVIMGVALILLVSRPLLPQFSEPRTQIQFAIGTQNFDFVSWAIAAFQAKIASGLAQDHAYLTEEAQIELVRDYIDLLRETRLLEIEIDSIYADPSILNPEAATEDARATVAINRETLSRMVTLVESILQDQIATVLIEEGFAPAGRVFPPVQARITPLPTVLIVSPRDEIFREYAIPLSAGMSTQARVAIESQILTELDRAPMVTNIGGLAFYPSMTLETTNLNFLIEVIAHEWAHHWFFQYPLGQLYEASGEVRTINETAANIIGKEVGAEVIRRYYPDLAPPPPADSAPAPAEPLDPPPFNFRDEMRVTRIEVDRLLAEGDINGAEAYMNDRRALFVENGYNLRIINQAYFAFHGAYADVSGAAGEDPIGPLVNRLRGDSDSIREFMRALRYVTSLSDLQSIIGGDLNDFSQPNSN